MSYYFNDIVALTHAATRLANYPGTEGHFARLQQFADWFEREAQAHEYYFAQACVPAVDTDQLLQTAQASQLRRAAPMREQSMSRTPELPTTEHWEEGQQTPDNTFDAMQPSAQ